MFEKIVQEVSITNQQIRLTKYNYNPFTNNLPKEGDWIYYLYQRTDNENVLREFDHSFENVVDDENVWFLAAGPGGEGGMSEDKAKGGGGGGGPGELVLKNISNKVYNGISCSIGYLCNSIHTLSDKNFTKITNTLNPSSELEVTVYGGFKGKNTSKSSGGRGGNGGGLCVGKTDKITFNTVNKNTPKNAEYRFGSGCGGGGTNSSSGYGFYGNTVTTLEIKDNTYRYKNMANDDSKEYDSRGKDGKGCIVDFGKTLNQKQCDNTGTATILQGGAGGDIASAGSNGPPGFIMVFHKTTKPLTQLLGGNIQKK